MMLDDKSKISFLRNTFHLQTSVVMKVMKMGKGGQEERGTCGRNRWEETT